MNRLNNICIDLLEIDAIVKSLIFNWSFLVPQNLSKFSCPQKISSSSLIVLVMSHKSVFFSHFSSEILSNINCFLGSRSIEKLSILQVKNTLSTNITAHDLYKNKYNSMFYENLKNSYGLNESTSSRFISQEDMQEKISKKIDNDRLKSSLNSLYCAIINKA